MIQRILKFALNSAAVGISLLICVGGGCEIFDPLASSLREGPELRSNADELRATSVSPYLEAPIVMDRSVIWCGTMQLAWNELCKMAGGPVQVRPPVPEVVTILNRQEFQSSDLDAESYVAVAGNVSDGIYSRIGKLIDEKFQGSARPAHLPPHDSRATLVAYAYLFKQLDFATPFERFESPLTFKGKKVTSFGMESGKPGHEAMAKQVVILDYRTEDDFAIELKTKSAGDRLILAKISPGPTLADTIVGVQKRIAPSRGEAALPDDVLQIPKMNFEIARKYRELEGLHVLPTSPPLGNAPEILQADQEIRFLMDEKGVILRSQAQMSFGCAVEMTPEPRHRMVFDKPFLLELIRSGTSTPYFVCWVGEGEILAGAK